MKNYLKDAKFLAFEIIPSLTALKLIGNVGSFLDWFKSQYPNKNPNDFYDGYKFAIHCCLNTFVRGIESDSVFNFKTTFQFERAIANLVPVHSIEIDCEKAIFLKNISTYIKPILKSIDFQSLENRLAIFNSAITDKFEKIWNNNVEVNKKLKIDLQTAYHLNLINFAQTFFLQIGSLGPYANARNIISPTITTKERLDVCFSGYKYAIQFFWWVLLGSKKFNTTSLIKLHLASSWKIYRHHKKKKNEDPNELDNPFFKEKRLDLKFQKCLDSYFYRVSNEITNPLDKKYKLPLYSIQDHFKFNFQNFNRDILFHDLLKSIDSPTRIGKLSKEEAILEKLSWYPFEIIDTNLINMHLGPPSFNTLLAGSVALFKKRKSEFPRVLVTKFIHPLEKNSDKKDYSFGILIDTMSAASENSSGWIIFQDACSNYSGFAHHQYQTTQSLIDKYIKQEKIELRELTISLSEFRKFTGNSTLLRKESFSFFSNSQVLSMLDKARSYSFELFVYSLYLREYGNTHQVDFNTSKKEKEGEIDVLIHNEKEVILIECKLNPQNCNLDEEIVKVNTKLSKYCDKETSSQFWFWQRLSPQNEAILKRKSISYVVVSEKNHPWLKSIDFSSFNSIMKEK